MIWALLALILLALAAWPFWIESRRAPPPPAPAGEVVDLPRGQTRRRWIGPARGPVIVAVHGLTTPSDVFDALARGLAATGYRVLVYDLYGRGSSATVAGAQDDSFFLRQLDDLLAAEELDEDITFLGYSMGGAIVTAFAAARPEAVKRVILLAPAGIVPARGTGSGWMRQVPMLGDWAFLAFWPHRFRREQAAQTAAQTAAPQANPALTEVQISQTRRRGFAPSVLSSLRGILATAQEAEHRKIHSDGVPLVAIWGTQDAVIPIAGLGQLAQWNRDAKQETIEGAGHGLPFTHAREVIDTLRPILRET